MFLERGKLKNISRDGSMLRIALSGVLTQSEGSGCTYSAQYSNIQTNMKFPYNIIYSKMVELIKPEPRQKIRDPVVILLYVFIMNPNIKGGLNIKISF